MFWIGDSIWNNIQIFTLTLLDSHSQNADRLEPPLIGVTTPGSLGRDLIAIVK
jgi:hypothetical protein